LSSSEEEICANYHVSTSLDLTNSSSITSSKIKFKKQLQISISKVNLKPET